ncbi:hypothetical protein PG987_011466 [Apiospora arundinis]
MSSSEPWFPSNARLGTSARNRVTGYRVSSSRTPKRSLERPGSLASLGTGLGSWESGSLGSWEPAQPSSKP